MRHATPAALAALLLLLSTSASRAQDPEADFDGFRIPDHTLRTLGANLGGAFAPSRYHDAFQSRRRQDSRGDLSGQFLWWRDSEVLQKSLAVGAFVSGTRVWQREKRDFTSGVSEQSEDWYRRTAERWSISGGLKRYFGSRPIAVSVASDLEGSYAQEWSKDRAERRNYPSTGESLVQEDHASVRDRLHSASLSVGLGVGRVRDATGIYDAHVLELRLQELGVLARPLSPEARRNIAQLHYVVPSLGRAYDRPDKRFWHDLERILIEDGAIPGPLEAHALLRIVEDAGPATGVARRTGFFVGPMVAAWAARREIRLEGGSYAEVHTPDTAYAVTITRDSQDHATSETIHAGGQAEFHRPIGPRWQVDATASVMFPLLHVRKGGSGGTSAQITYLVADRWLGRATFTQSRTYLQPDPGRGFPMDNWLVRCGVGADYYVEDRVKLSLSFEALQGRSYLSNFQRAESIRLAVGYSFISDFDAPGLVTPLPPP